MPRIYRPEPKPKRYTENRQRRHQLVYNDPRWRPLREQVMARDGGLCQECLKQGRLTPATQVHHLVSPFIVGLPPSDFEFYAWNMDNLEAICHECHAAIHAHEGQTHG